MRRPRVCLKTSTVTGRSTARSKLKATRRFLPFAAAERKPRTGAHAAGPGTPMSASFYSYPNTHFSQAQKDRIRSGPYGRFLS